MEGLDTADPENLLAVRGKVGMVFQNPDNQIVASVVEEDVAFGPENLGVPPAEIRQRVDTALHMVGMYDLREHSPHLLSGGQILITHHMDEAAQAQRLIVMAGGHIIDDGPPTEVFQHVDTLRSAGLAVPETVGLLYELKKEGLPVPLDAIRDEDCAAVLAGLLQ